MAKVALAVATLVTVVAMAYAHEEIAQLQYPIGDVRNCPTRTPHDDTEPLYRMEVLPGNGFDSLRSEDMGQVHFFNYSNCHVSKDGRYLLPDNTFLIPAQESQMEMFAEYFEHWDNYTSITSKKMGLEAHFFSFLSGKYSSQYQTMKTQMHRNNAISTRVQIRSKRYTVHLQSNAQLHPVFKTRVFEIGEKLLSNDTVFATYLAEVLVSDFGTHYITSMDVGAAISQTDFINSEYASEGSGFEKLVTAEASANFFNSSLGFSFQHSSENKEASDSGFIKNRTYSEISTFGGPAFRPGITLAEWQEGVPNALVAIDRSGKPLTHVINTINFPDLPDVTVYDVADVVYKAIDRYYKENTRIGCTDRNSDNFDFQATNDDGSCNLVSLTNLTLHFGGIFQTCTANGQSSSYLCSPDGAAQTNVLTGDYSCPEGFNSTKLHSGTISASKMEYISRTDSYDCGFFLWADTCYREVGYTTSVTHSAEYEAYWCFAPSDTQAEHNSGLLFGGFYTSKHVNDYTKSMSCPQYYDTLHFGKDLYVCVSSAIDLAYGESVDFAGIYSCSVGNPLTATETALGDENRWPRSCHPGYTPLVVPDDGCDIYFCVESSSFRTKSLLPIHLPPFRDRPKSRENITNTVVVSGMNGRLWVKNDQGTWDQIDTGNADSQQFFQILSKNEKELKKQNGGLIAGTTIFATLFFATAVVLVVFFIKKRRSNKKYKNIS